MRPGRIVYVGHATVLVELDGVRVLTDPVLGRWIGPLHRQGASPGDEVVAGLDAVLISHLHRDHLDWRSLRRLGQVPVIAPAGTGALFAGHGIREVIELAPGESHRIRAAGGRPGGGGAPGGPGDKAAVTITATRADHEIGRRGTRAAPVGFLVEGSRRVYFAGDTDLFDAMAELRPLDLALLPVWGWGPNLGPGHLNPERAARAAALLAPRVAVPIHWGTFYPAGLARLRPRPLDGPPHEFAARLGDLAPAVTVEILAPGSSLDMGGS